MNRFAKPLFGLSRAAPVSCCHCSGWPVRAALDMPISSQAPGQDAKTQLFRRRLGASSQDIRIPDKLEKDGIVAITENEVNDKASPGYPGEWRPS